MAEYSYYSPRRVPPKKRRRGIFKKFLILAILAGVVFGGYNLYTNIKNGNGIGSIKTVVKPQPPRALSTEGRYLFNGTVVWARRMQQWATKPDGTIDYAYPFSGMNTFNREQYDAWTADLECASGIEVIPMATQESSLIFNCRPEFLPEAAKYFNFFNLANNHSDNLGADGFEETRKHLADNGVQAYGNYEPAKKQDICEVVALPVRINMSDKTVKKANLPVAFCAWHYFYRLPQPGEIEHMTQYSEIMPVFGFLQMGVEYRPVADEMQQSVSRRIIDAGADFLIVNSAHWVQNSEAYKGKLIVYSTGNFLFDQQFNSEVTRSASIDTTMTLTHDANLDKWIKLGEECSAKTLHDDCFEKAKTQGLAKPKYTFKYAPIAGDNSGKLSKKASPAIQQAVEERLDWAQTLQGLEMP